MEQSLNFESLGLSTKTVSVLGRAGLVQPTPIQQRAIPPALAGRDLVGCAATGTGKTAAFVLPLMERLKRRAGTQALVLVPTRELAFQIEEQIQLLGSGSGIRGAVIVGGTGMAPQLKALRDGFEVIVATPGRLVDHLRRNRSFLSGVKVLVLDEADRMLDMGFKPQLEQILSNLPKSRQTLLFSATMAAEVAKFAKSHLENPERVEIARSGTVAKRAEQRVFHLPQGEKNALLVALLSEDQHSTLVFTKTKRRADRLFQALQGSGHPVERIHAGRTLSQRRKVLEGFRKGEYRVLVATDIAARGLDVECIGHVVNFDLPQVPEDYVHRVGRTARAAASGQASSFCSPDERLLLRNIESFTRQSIQVIAVPRECSHFQDEMKKGEQKQKDPGPRSRNHGVSGRPAGKPAGRHARTHPQKRSFRSGAEQKQERENLVSTTEHPRQKEEGDAKVLGPKRRFSVRNSNRVREQASASPKSNGIQKQHGTFSPGAKRKSEKNRSLSGGSRY